MTHVLVLHAGRLEASPTRASSAKRSASPLAAGRRGPEVQLPRRGQTERINPQLPEKAVGERAGPASQSAARAGACYPPSFQGAARRSAAPVGSPGSQPQPTAPAQALRRQRLEPADWTAAAACIVLSAALTLEEGFASVICGPSAILRSGADELGATGERSITTAGGGSLGTTMWRIASQRRPTPQRREQAT